MHMNRHTHKHACMPRVYMHTYMCMNLQIIIMCTHTCLHAGFGAIRLDAPKETHLRTRRINSIRVPPICMSLWEYVYVWTRTHTLVLMFVFMLALAILSVMFVWMLVWKTHICIYVYLRVYVCIQNVCIMFKHIIMIFFDVCVYIYIYTHISMTFTTQPCMTNQTPAKESSQTWRHARKLDKTPIPHTPIPPYLWFLQEELRQMPSAAKSTYTYISLYMSAVLYFYRRSRVKRQHQKHDECIAGRKTNAHCMCTCARTFLCDDRRGISDTWFACIHTHARMNMHIHTRGCACMHVCQRRNKQTHEHTRMVEKACIFMIHAHTNTTHETRACPCAHTCTASGQQTSARTLWYVRGAA